MTCIDEQKRAINGAVLKLLLFEASLAADFDGGKLLSFR